ncbi:MAG: hypothetical protein ABIR96_01470, partial [Bdellovibrionota bacterium]
MSRRESFYLFALLLGASSAFASEQLPGEFAPKLTATKSVRKMQTDCKYLYRAMKQADFKWASVRAARNWEYGPSTTILSKDETPWAGNYFPMMNGGLANRWHLRKAVEKTLDMAEDGTQLSSDAVKAKIKAMKPEELANLSPAEKMDIYSGNYDFRITKHELKARGPQRRSPPEDWEGFCNGMRAAGICQPEPRKPILVKNADGVEVPFDPSDVKGLAGASYFYTEKYSAMGAPTRTLGLKNQ